MSARRVAGAPVVRPPGESAADLFARRQSLGQGVLRRRLLVLLLAVAVVSGVVWVVGWSSALAVRGVQIEGLTGADAKAAEALVREQLGTPLIRVDTDRLADSIGARKAVAAVRVDRSWPSTLVVVGVQRTPALVLRNSQGQLEVVDATGVRFGTVAKRPSGVPFVTASGSAGTSEEALRTALSVVRSLPPELARTVRDITVSSASLVSFTTGSTTVVWGGAGDEVRKAELIKALLPRKPGTIDVSAPDTPVTR